MAMAPEHGISGTYRCRQSGTDSLKWVMALSEDSFLCKYPSDGDFKGVAEFSELQKTCAETW